MLGRGKREVAMVQTLKAPTFQLLFLLIPLLFLQPLEAFAKANEIKKTGKCEYTITVKIKVHSWPGKNNATQALVDAWKKGIESKWNGPSKEVAEAIAAKLGIDPKKLVSVDEDKRTPEGEKIGKLAEKLLKDEGVKGLMHKCCTYKVVADISLAKTALTNATTREDLKKMAKKDGYHHVVAVGGDHRSFVNTPLKDGAIDVPKINEGTYGLWSDKDPGEVAAHETGHLMGFDDQYEEKDGKCTTKPGGENKNMDWANGWPSVKDFEKEILDKNKVKCDCCKDGKLVDGFWTRLNRTMLAAMDAILTCNREVLEQAMKDLADQKKVIEAALIPLSDKKPLIARLDDQVDKIKAALKDCSKETVAIDSGAYCEHWPWEIPGGLFIPEGVSTPPTTTGTPTPDGSTPPKKPSTPEKPTIGYPGEPLFPYTMPPEDEDRPSKTPKEKEKPKAPPPTTYAKVEKKVIENGKSKSVPVVGIKMKFSKLAPPLPTKGNKKVDKNFDEDPDIAVSDKNGNIKRKVGSNSSRYSPGQMPHYTNVLEDILGITPANAAPRTPDQSILRINYAPIESFIVRIRIDRSKKEWDRPVTYLGEKVGRHVIRSWVLNDILYAVINIRKGAE